MRSTTRSNLRARLAGSVTKKPAYPMNVQNIKVLFALEMMDGPRILRVRQVVGCLHKHGMDREALLHDVAYNYPWWLERLPSIAVETLRDRVSRMCEVMGIK